MKDQGGNILFQNSCAATLHSFLNTMFLCKLLVGDLRKEIIMIRKTKRQRD